MNDGERITDCRYYKEKTVLSHCVLDKSVFPLFVRYCFSKAYFICFYCA